MYCIHELNVKTIAVFMGKGFHRYSPSVVPHKKRGTSRVILLVHDSGALTALQPIDMNHMKWNLELTAQTIINDEFSNSEIILGFVISARDPELFQSMEDWSPVPP